MSNLNFNDQYGLLFNLILQKEMCFVIVQCPITKYPGEFSQIKIFNPKL